MSITPAGSPTPPFTYSGAAEEARLKKTATQLEGLFVQRMFAAMRDTVPDGGIVDKSSAEGTFTQLLDEKMSERVPAQWSGAHSLATALYNQLRRQLPSAQTTPSTESPK